MRSNKAAFVLSVLVSCSMALAQQVEHPHERTSLPSDARYEIVQATIAARGTYMLDRWTGSTYVLTVDQDEADRWVRMQFVGNLPIITRPDTPNFQLFVSGIAMKHTFLLNVFTGETWRLVRDAKNELVWERFR